MTRSKSRADSVCNLYFFKKMIALSMGWNYRRMCIDSSLKQQINIDMLYQWSCPSTGHRYVPWQRPVLTATATVIREPKALFEDSGPIKCRTFRLGLFQVKL